MDLFIGIMFFLFLISYYFIMLYFNTEYNKKYIKQTETIYDTLFYTEENCYIVKNDKLLKSLKKKDSYEV